jgi:hypothetical protein
MKLANPGLIKQLSGRKGDAKGARWTAECLQKELIMDSFVPDKILQQIRHHQN